MAKFRPGLTRFARILLTRGIAALLLLHTIALGLSEARRAPMEPGLASSSRLCASMSGTGHAPLPAEGPGHCLYCPLACAAGDAGFSTLPTATRLSLAPRDGATARAGFEIAARPVAGAAGFRQFSRAPPAA